MSKMKELYFDIEDMILNTELSFPEISERLGVPIDFVYQVAEDIGEFDE